MPWPTPMHIVQRAYRPVPPLSRRTAVVTRRAPLAPSGWPSAIAPPSALTCGASSGSAERAGDGQRLRRKRLVQLDDVDLGHLHAGAREQPLGRGHRPDAHDARRHACGSERHDARAWREAVFADRGARGDNQRARAVVDPGRVARSDGAVSAHEWRELRQRLERRVGTRMFIGAHRHDGLLLCDFDRHDLFRETSGLLGGGGALLAAERKCGPDPGAIPRVRPRRFRRSRPSNRCRSAAASPG